MLGLVVIETHENNRFAQSTDEVGVGRWEQKDTVAPP